MQDPASSPAPQFSIAERPGTDVCKFCQQLVTGGYYLINNQMACAGCADRAQREVPIDSHAAFMGALLLGIPAAIAGLIFYAGFTIMTGWMIGYVSLAVGFIVGKAIMMGSKGIGGRRYQIAAVLLTYAAVSMAAIPISLWQYKHSRTADQAQSYSHNQTEPSSGEQPAPSEQPTPENANANKPHLSLGTALVKLTFIGLISPFLELQEDVFHGAIGLIILFVGLRIAWRSTAGVRVDVHGPYESSTPATTR